MDNSTKKLILPLCLLVFYLIGCQCSQTGVIDNNGDKNGNLLKSQYNHQTGPYLFGDDDNDFFVVTNIADQCIKFPNNFNLKIYAKLSDQWTEIKNNLTYLPQKDHILKPHSDFASMEAVAFTPL
jgi:hypothetical protein